MAHALDEVISMRFFLVLVAVSLGACVLGGVAGGFMQPQAQVQVLIHLLERGLHAQAAIDEPRFKLLFGGDLALEEGHPLCALMPDAAARPPGPEGYGAAQVAGIVDGRTEAGADGRRGGAAALVD